MAKDKIRTAGDRNNVVKFGELTNHERVKPYILPIQTHHGQGDPFLGIHYSFTLRQHGSAFLEHVEFLLGHLLESFRADRNPQVGLSGALAFCKT